MSRRADEGQLSFDDLFGDIAEVPATPRRLLDPAEVAARCGLSYAPSPEQARVVSAPPDRPLVVVAGAGSGKTETMAARVSWLVANRLVEPEAILGLTFTRKAASELNERVRLRLGALARHRDTDDDLRRRLDIAQPTVSTYHGYAAALVAEHGLRIGVEPGAGVLGPAMCWGQAATVVDVVDRRHERRPADPAHHDRGRPGAGLRARRARHQPGGPARVDRPARGADRGIRGRPSQEGAVQGRHRHARPPEGAGGAAAAGRGVRGAQAGSRRHRLRRPGGLRGTDRGRRRPRSADASGPAGRSSCSTSTRTPASVSSGCSRPCSAGTPGTRCSPSATPASRSTAGAGRRPARSSASPAPSPACPTRPAERLTLATSWRNDDAVLAVANAVSGMLPPPDQPLPDLAPAPTAGRGAVSVGLYGTVAEETEALADRLAELLERRGPDGKRPTVAVLVRARKQLPGIAAALRERGAAGRGRRARRTARGARGLRRRRDADRAGRPDRRRCARPAAHRCPLADRPARPRRPRGTGAGAGALASSRPGRGDATPPSRRPTERGSIVEALDDLGGPDAYSAGGLPPAAPARRGAGRTCARG